MKKKNLIIYYPSFERGGVEHNLINLINNFDKNIYVHLISTINEDNSKKIFKKKNFKVYEVKKKKFLNFLPNRFNTAFSSISILKYLTRKLRKQNLIVHSMQSNIAAIIVCLLNNTKIVIRNSEDPISSTIYSENVFISYCVFFLKIIFYNLCDGIITNSKGSKSSIEKFVFNKKKIKAIYNPYLKNLNKKVFKKDNLIINIGRFRKQKNQTMLIKAFFLFQKKFQKYKLLLVGDGILKKKLVNEVDNLGLNKKVLITGWSENTHQYLKRSKIFVLSSLYEGLGNVLIDSINYNVPCISTDCKSGPREILLNGRGGFLVKNNNVRDLYNKMIFCEKNYKDAVKKNEISKKKLKRFFTVDRVKDYEKYLLKFENI